MNNEELNEMLHELDNIPYPEVKYVVNVVASLNLHQQRIVINVNVNIESERKKKIKII